MNAILLANMQFVMRDAEAASAKKAQAINKIKPVEGSVEYQYLTKIFKYGSMLSTKLREGQERCDQTLPTYCLKKYLENGYVTFDFLGGNRGGIWKPAPGITADMLNIDLTEH